MQLKSFYVDDYLGGADYTEQAIQLQEEMCYLFQIGGFLLHKWNCSDAKVLQRISPELRDSRRVITLSDSEQYTKTVGIEWNPHDDSSEHVPQQVSYHGVLILTPTVVSVEVDVLLFKPMYFKEVMEHTDDGVCSLASINWLVNKVIDSTQDSLTAYSKDGTLSWGKEVHRPWLLGVIRVEYLLGHVESVVSYDEPWAGLCCWAMSKE